MDWKVHFDGDAFGGVDVQTDKVLYIEQLFDHDPGYTDRSIRKGDAMAAIGSFVLDEWKNGFTPPGISRLNDSIRTLVWGILGSQTQVRNTILGSDTQKQFLANIEDAINSEIDLPSSIERYQSTLQYARSKLDFVIGIGLYLIPSNMEMQVGVINNYNNLIQITTDDMKVGLNANVNVEMPMETPVTTETEDEDKGEDEDKDEDEDEIFYKDLEMTRDEKN